MATENHILEAAAEWFAIQRRGPMSLDEREAFDLWRADPRHQAALNRMHELWGETSSLKGANLPIPNTRRNRLISAGIAASLIAGVAVGSYVYSSRQATAPIVTGIGEQRSQTLSDGSIVAVNVDSHIRYDTSPAIRRVRLDEGEATFIVKKEAARPFLVVAADYEVRAIGTAFNVRHRNGMVHVAVKEGIVEVHRKDGYERPVRLLAGQRLSLKPGATLRETKLDTVDTRTVDEWRQRVLSYENTPVTTVAEDLNRFFEKPIVVDPSLAQSRVTIRLIIDDRQDTLTRLAGILNAEVKHTPKHDRLVSSLH